MDSSKNIDAIIYSIFMNSPEKLDETIYIVMLSPFTWVTKADIVFVIIAVNDPTKSRMKRERQNPTTLFIIKAIIGREINNTDWNENPYVILLITVIL